MKTQTNEEMEKELKKYKQYWSTPSIQEMRQINILKVLVEIRDLLSKLTEIN